MDMQSGNIIDISLPLRDGMSIYPDNPSFLARMERNGETYVSTLTMGSHTGTHIDAPRHRFENGKGVDSIELSRFVGRARVLDMTGVAGGVTKESLLPKNVKANERILIKTSNSVRGFSKFYDDFVYLESDAAAYLAGVGVLLIGIDSLSVKKRSGGQEAHDAFLAKGIPIVEGLDLSKVFEGEYTFVGLPLRLEGIDASPIRAVLIR